MLQKFANYATSVRLLVRWLLWVTYLHPGKTFCFHLLVQEDYHQKNLLHLYFNFIARTRLYSITTQNMLIFLFSVQYSFQFTETKTKNPFMTQGFCRHRESLLNHAPAT